MSLPCFSLVLLCPLNTRSFGCLCVVFSTSAAAGGEGQSPSPSGLMTPYQGVLPLQPPPLGMPWVGAKSTVLHSVHIVHLFAPNLAAVYNRTTGVDTFLLKAWFAVDLGKPT